MTGVELTVGGWFAAAIIRKFVDKAGNYLCDNKNLHKETKRMLNNLKIRFTEIQTVLKETEKGQIQNNELTEWRELIKAAAYEAQDVLDDFEAKKICEDLNSTSKVSTAKGGKKFLLIYKDVQKLKQVVSNLEKLCEGFPTVLWSLKLDLDRKGKGLPSTECGEMIQVLPHDQTLFGRDTEIKIILTIILGYEIESLESETISEGDKNLVRASSKFDIGIGLHKISQNMSGMIWQKLSELFGITNGDVGGASSQESATGAEAMSSLEHGTRKRPESSQMSSDRGKIVSTNIAGLTAVVKNIEQSSGREKAQKLLFELEPTQQTGHYGRPFVIPLVGISGVGKTALAQTIYEHPILEGHFSIKAWVYVTRQFNVRKLVQEFFPYDISHYDQRNLKELITENIEGTRFLLVLDDVCSEFCLQLQDLLSWFNVGAYGSVILVTTKENNVSNIFGTIGPIRLNPLDWDNFLPLLEHYAFKNVHLTEGKKDALKQACEVIGRQLHGIPQAAKIMGNMLQLNMDIEHWKLVSLNPKHYHNGIFSFLEIAYQHLDSNLKQCFAFCSIFPTNYIIHRDRIIQMWIANNFIQSNSSDEPKCEDIGKRWFNKLVNFSFFLPTPWPDMYIMNSATRELAKSVSSDVAFYSNDHPNPCPYGCFILNEHFNLCIHGYSVSDDAGITIPPSTRHLTVRTNKPIIDLSVCSDKLRTLLFLCDYDQLPVIKQKKSGDLISRIIKKPSGRTISFNGFLESTGKLRILELSVELNINAICQLSHLRFLDLSFSGINQFPESLCTLYHLQVLDVRGCEFKCLPKKMNRLINLRHLHASNDTIFLITAIGKLANLQELEEFRVIDEEGHTIRELAEMKEISGHLSIVNLDNIKDDSEAQEARLADKKYLKALSLRWDNLASYYSRPNIQGILNSLKPHSDLEELEIENYYDTKLPSWITLTLVNIRCIYLRKCHNVTLLPLGQLPLLHTLHLERLPTLNIGEELYGTGQVIFPSLKVLKFVELIKWTVWPTAEERELFPRLEELRMIRCSNLRKTPLASLDLLNLRELELDSCPHILNGGGIFNKRLPKLTSIKVSGITVVTIPVHHVPNLKTLSIDHSNVCFEGDTQSLSNLKTLRTPFILDVRLPYLKVLDIGTKWISRNYPISLLEEWLIKLNSLAELTLCGLKEFPSNFATIISLRTLTLKYLTSESLPDGGMPPNLKELYIWDASDQLKQRCRPDQGEDWHKIACIPYLRVNGETLQML